MKEQKELLIALIIQLSFVYPVCAQRKPDRERDGLIGLVKSVYVEMARLSYKDGKWVETPAFMIGGNGDYSRKGWGPWGRRPKGGGYGTSHGGHGEFIFDDEGNRTEAIHYSSDNQLTERDHYEYDKSGHELEETRYDADGQLKQRTIHIYDSNGRRIEEVSYSGDGILKEKRLYKNDEKGNVVEELFLDSSGLKERRTLTYELDSAGNWIKRISYLEVAKDGESSFDPEIITRRKITYY